MNIRPLPTPSRKLAAFTLIELLVSVAILSVLVIILAGAVNSASVIWRRTNAKVEQFREARTAFEALTTTLSQATLNTYLDYNNPTAPTRYERRSELRFISGPTTRVNIPGGADRPTHCVFFQAPLGDTSNPNYRGFENLLGTVGYYLEYNDDSAFRPGFLNDLPGGPVLKRIRHRLMEVREIAERPGIYEFTSGKPNYIGQDWIGEAVKRDLPGYFGPRPIAENIIALVLTPRLSKRDEGSSVSGSPLAPNYLYDSTKTDDNPKLNPKNQLPPIIEVTMVAVDEASVQRLGDDYEGVVDTANKFQNSGNIDRDLLAADPQTGAENPGSLESTLIANKVNYRIFSSRVAIPGAKWSTTQKN